MQNYGGWRKIKPLGDGGQSEVFLVRSPARVAERDDSLQTIRSALDRDKRGELADAIWTRARPDLPSEVGALKIFKISHKGLTPSPAGTEDREAVQRLKNEVTVLSQDRPGLPKLLDANEGERWIVTEFFHEGTLEDNFSKYRGEAARALRVFRHLVATVASLHRDSYVHRDIKPSNVFVHGDKLVLGDFGIVHMPPLGERVTLTNERVGPRDYMPQWADLGERLENVPPNFDVYMLGKLLWCMVAGKLKLPREYHRRPQFDLEKLFPSEWHMRFVNLILDRCLVEEAEQCLPSGQQLLELVDKQLASIDRGGGHLDRKGRFSMPCRVCGKGHYQPFGSKTTLRLQEFDDLNRNLGTTNIRAFICSICRHYEFFAAGYPEEAASRNWNP